MLIGISGGIGSGKSVVSRVLRLKGLPVYDCDSEAKRLMAESDRIKERIRDEISSDVTDGLKIPDCKVLAEIVFNDEKARMNLNDIVHGEVRFNLLERYHERSNLWVEAAILAESGLAALCDRIWKVETPHNIRISNIMRRDHCSEEHALKRIKAQRAEEILLSEFESITDSIFNDSTHSILYQIDELLKELETNYE